MPMQKIINFIESIVFWVHNTLRMGNPDNESAQFNLGGSGEAKFSWKSNPAKTFLFLLIIGFVFFFALTLSTNINENLIFFVAVSLLVGVTTFLMIHLRDHPEDFQDSETWYNYKTWMPSDDKNKELIGEESFGSPVLKSKQVLKLK